MSVPVINITHKLRLALQQEFAPSLMISTHMDDSYDYFRCPKDQDPDDAFEEIQRYRDIISETLATLPLEQHEYLENYLAKHLSLVVHGSNLIEKAGLDVDTMLEFGSCLFSGGYEFNEGITTTTSEYERIRLALTGQSSDKDMLQSYHEVVQHCKAFIHILNAIIVEDQPLSEDMILQTHKILTLRIQSSSGDHWKEYGGRYRKHSVAAGFTSFTPPEQVSTEMRIFVAEYHEDLQQAQVENSMDPYMLAAKYCHKFVNIHPFADGNGRMCRLILNAILLKYAGIAVILGKDEDERMEYLGIAARASEAAISSTDDDDFLNAGVPWGELASCVLFKAQHSTKGLLGVLRG